MCGGAWFDHVIKFLHGAVLCKPLAVLGVGAPHGHILCFSGAGLACGQRVHRAVLWTSSLLRLGGRLTICCQSIRVFAGRRRVLEAPPYCGLEVGLVVVLGALGCEWGGWQRANHLDITCPLTKSIMYHM